VSSANVGISFFKTYISNRDIGRLYEEFWTQWTFGLAEFSDMPMEQPPDEDCKSGCFRAKYTTDYLENYVDQKSHAGHSLREKIQFGVEVQTIKKLGDNWHLSGLDSSNNMLHISTEKLIIANGGNAGQNFPDLPDKDTFEGIILHSEEFGESNVISSKDLQHVAVIGAGKSSADMIYESVKAGKTVSWIISNNGTGPGFFAPLDMKTPYKNAAEAAQTRLLSSFQPSLLNEHTLWTWFLHSTRIGVGIVKGMFLFVDKEVRKRADYTGRKSTKGFEKLKYDPG
jgi:dimethylaniline monooxygenase (N-oxide forming)